MGRFYKVLFLINTAGDGAKYPYTVVYEDTPIPAKPMERAPKRLA